MTPKQWGAPCALPFHREYRRLYERDTARSQEADVFDSLRRAVALDDEQAERDLAEVLAGCSPEELDELAALAEMDGDEWSRFSTLSEALKAKGARDPDALAAYIGRKKYGRSKFAAMHRSEAPAEPAMWIARSDEYLRTPADWVLDDIHILQRAQGGDGRTVEAYIAVFDKKARINDQHGEYDETVDRAAFNRTLAHGIDRLAVHYHHGMTLHGTPSDLGSVPIGHPKEITPDGRGLRVIDRYNTSPLAESVLAAINNGDPMGYSFRGRIFRSDPQGKVPRVRPGQPLPSVRRLELGLSEYGPTPTPYYTDARVLAVRSAQHIANDIAALDETNRRELITVLSRSTPQDPEQEPATPTEGPGAEDPHEPVHSGRQLSDIARKIRRARFLQEHTNEHEEA